MLSLQELYSLELKAPAPAPAPKVGILTQLLPPPPPQSGDFEIKADARAEAVGIAFLCTGPKDSRIWNFLGTSRVPGRLSEII